jgi:hypothetical protein
MIQAAFRTATVRERILGYRTHAIRANDADNALRRGGSRF